MDRAFASNVSATPPAMGAAIGYPQDGDPSSGKLPTTPGAGWFHAVTEELRAIIVAGGGTPDKNTLNQVEAAIENLISTAVNAAVATVEADSTTKANNAQTNAISAAAADATTKSNNARTGAVSDVNAEFTGSNRSLALPGFQKFPGLSGALLHQWLQSSVAGSTSTSVTFPFAFPNGIIGVLAVPTGSTLPSTPVTVVSQTAAGCVIDCQNNADTPGAFLLAIGW
ncbi:MAG: gp53-like domain-containing protein [Dokdonella sp.]|uniref:gp53-like domain-containing protein n=1 Tax=Dokdonella sp. TaxID=2291710 RepID=UPI003F7FCFA2